MAGSASLVAVLSSTTQAAQAELAATRGAAVAGRLLLILRHSRAGRLSHRLLAWRRAVQRAADGDSTLALAREVTALRSGCSSRDATIAQLHEQVT